ncbi:hypothetical protein FBEOM_93 [Fusarium beomiforme]|uniref:RRM domain-containing protein n=1 Tax=Fusarium beomiforme TaxID=44412 RepID=A0A9P5AVU5_9HYPO|nr:hypothetical protein FBEOM_93 [Fusarium beomiforme]
MSAEATAASSDYIRLHISPLDPDLFRIVIPASAAPKARNISYHTIETFPERRYGFVELPTMEAEKVKKKLNGAVLKGNKIRIEKARPEERVEPTGKVNQEEEENFKKKKKKSKESKEESRKRKRDPDVIEGVALTDRKVKRGWTEPADQRRKKSKQDKEKEKDGKHTEKKKRLKSKYTDGDECLLKTKVPPNVIANLPEDDQPRKRKKGKSREVIVHEFEKTTKFPSFLKNSVDEGETNTATEFVEGKGWVDENGNVVETVKEKKIPEPAPKKKKVKKATPPPVEDSDDDTSSSGTSSSGSSDEESEDEMEADAEVEEKKEKITKEAPQTNDKSSSDSEDDLPKPPQPATPLSAIKADETRPMSSSSSRSLTIKIPPPATPSTKVHPLEALYKRAKPDETTTETPAKKEAEPFSFFGGADNDDIEDEEDQDPANQTVSTPAPMTPFSRQDFEWRNIRSAAPTPDTAHPSRMRNFWPEDEEDGEEDLDMADHGYDEDGDDKDTSAPQSSSDFQAWFWDNRRDLNRSWMKRRKTAAKEKRHRENKARASKAV